MPLASSKRFNLLNPLSMKRTTGLNDLKDIYLVESEEEDTDDEGSEETADTTDYKAIAEQAKAEAEKAKAEADKWKNRFKSAKADENKSPK